MQIFMKRSRKDVGRCRFCRQDDSREDVVKSEICRRPAFAYNSFIPATLYRIPNRIG